MPRRIKRLREQKKLTQVELAKNLDVDVKTIRNWEKDIGIWENTNGIIPSIQKMKELAIALDVSTYEVFDAFMSYKDKVESEFKWNNHSHDFETGSKPFQLFSYIVHNRLYGEGFVIYKYRLFRYKELQLHILPLMNPDNAIEEELMVHSFKPSDGLIIKDEASNCMVLTENMIKTWKTASCDTRHTVFEIQTSVAYFPEMEEELKNRGICSFYLDAYKVSSEKELPYSKPDSLEIIEDANNILGLYIKKCREREKMTQEELAIELSSLLGIRAKKTTVNRWETGSLMPSAQDFAMLHVYFRMNAEKILDAYHHNVYISSAIDEHDNCYDLGIHHSFWSIKDYSTLKSFLNQYAFYGVTIHSKTLIIGSLICDGKEIGIRTLQTNEERIQINLDNGETIDINREDLISAIPYSLHLSLYYEIHISVKNENTVAEYSVGLAYNLLSGERKKTL